MILAVWFFFLQILWLVGTGQLIPNMEAIRSDTPRPLRRLMLQCIQHEREERPLFPHVLSVVENLMRTLPKIQRSLSEPILHRSNLHSDDLGGADSSVSGANATSPKTAGGNSVLA